MPAPLPVSRRREVVAAWLVARPNHSAAARIVGCHDVSIANWRETEWFQELEHELLESIESESKARARAIVKAGQEAALDRLERGEQKWDSERGELISEPVRAKDAAIIAGIWHDKLRIMESKPTKIILDQSLSAVMEQFKRLSTAYRAGAIEGELSPQSALEQGESGQNPRG